MFSYGFQEFVIIYVNVKLNCINIDIMDMNGHMLISLLISMLVGREKDWSSYKVIQVVIRKWMRQLSLEMR
jgi:hypothetical protein